MKREYDFSGGERGKFYHAELELEIPIYLEPEVAVVQKIAAAKGIAMEALVNDWLRKDIALIETVLHESSESAESAR